MLHQLMTGQLRLTKTSEVWETSEV
jgi:hypothetical protein